MSKHLIPIATVLTMTLAGGIVPAAMVPPTQNADVTAHEWGTFTTVAGPDGQAMQWLPLGGPTDLPCFIHEFKNRAFKVLPTEYGAQVDYEAARTALKGTVRMETPVIYFYASRETHVNVAVKFPQGILTEWYPNAAVDQSPVFENALTAGKSSPSSITWDNVTIHPGATANMAKDEGPSHYYAARETDAAPVDVGGESERFLFYRGVGGFSVPISTELQTDGRILVTNLGKATIPAMMVFRNEQGKIGYRIQTGFTGSAVVDAPPLDGNLDGLRETLTHTLMSEGLYPREAAAMVETWRDTWFEEGTRVFYIMPASAVNAILPLQIDPSPAKVVRVFVGRMDVITPASVAAVQYALAENDATLLRQYGRLLQPIADQILAKVQAPKEKARIEAQLNAVLKSYVARATDCHSTN